MELIEGYADVDDLDAFLDSLAEIGDEHGCVVQAFDARAVAGEAHLEHAIRTARRAIERGEAIARDPAVEVLCYAAGTRQIDEALELGVGEGRTPVVVLVAGGFVGAGEDRGADEDQGGDEDQGTGEERVGAEAIDDAETDAAAAVRALIDPADLERGTEFADPDRLRSFFEIGDPEMAASETAAGGDVTLETLVRERVALLAVER